MKRFAIALVAAMILCPVAAPVLAQPLKTELKAQFDARAGELLRLKQAGQVGETVEGYVEVVDAAAADDSAKQLVSDENKDRRRLYQLLADEINKENPKEKGKATPEILASRNAARNIERAGPDEFLRVGKDQWIRIRDYPRFQKIAALKAQGKVGETFDGLVEAVSSADTATTKLVNDENNARAAAYKAQAEKQRVDASAIAKQAAARNFENARVGEMLKEGGSWRKK